MLAVSSAASRHLPRRHRNASVVAANLRRAGGMTMTITDRASAAAAVSASSSRRHLSLRRTQTKGRRGPASSGGTTSPSSASSSEASAQQQQQQQQFRTTDPHSIANEMVSNSSSATRTPGTESVASLTNEQKMSNYAMAGGLLAFVSYVFYYSLASVGGENKARSLLFGQKERGGEEEGGAAGSAHGVNPGFEDFLREANEGRTSEEEKAREERRARGDARELVELEKSTAARLKHEGLGEEEVVAMVAGSANEEEEEEREMARIAGFVDGDTPEDGGVDDVARRRPMWKRVVFFWRRE